MSGESDKNIRFSELTGYLKRLGFEERVQGSHHIFTREGVAEQLVLQPLADGAAKSYQVRQVRGILEKYSLGADDD
ncbi:MAG: type II toxin-antitoxin system HicA family toxin [Fimbriimonadales bacterium]|nr:type II toxin-antitoxin system HicA family toxin [Fimbriimonadales bacterium]